MLSYRIVFIHFCLFTCIYFPCVKTYQNQCRCQVLGFCRKKEIYSQLYDTNILIDELGRESGNVAHFVGGSASLLGKGLWTVGKTIVPLLGKAIEGTVDTVSPIVQEKAGDLVNEAVPLLQEKAKDVAEYSAPLVQKTASQASKDVISIYEQLKEGETGKNIARGLRDVASVIDPTGIYTLLIDLEMFREVITTKYNRGKYE